MVRFAAILFFLHLASLYALAQHARCGAVEHRQQNWALHPGCKEIAAINETFIENWIDRYKLAPSSRSVVTIPVVVHVVWNTNEQNISDAQIYSQIAVLNQDYRAQNVEAPSVPLVFQDALADVAIEFCLASKDPSGAPTNGITRTYTDNSVGIAGTVSLHYTNLGGQDAWDTEHYLNIWVAKFAGAVGGIASFPGEDPPEQDGVEIDYRQFGNIALEPPYHLGRTATHEIGHYFNLEHPWGPLFNDCCADDFVDDTPEACETYLSQCPVHPVVSCDEADMFMNFMFYTDDACMAMFTKGQKMRMWATLNGPRSGLLESNGCNSTPTTEAALSEEFLIFSNPANSVFSFEIKSNSSGTWQVQLSDVLGRIVEVGTAYPNVRSEFGVRNLVSGIYWLKAKKGMKILAAKIALLR
ncbi:MAG: T9SS type A sorting domain-containing protein [Saprospiraceae bacterium]|nr:MAG: T9SS type A sorting domain-containing protein [Saprospiraceae bacterium]